MREAIDNEQAETAVQELRLFISLYEGAPPQPGSRTALQLEAARKAVAGYEEGERGFTARSA